MDRGRWLRFAILLIVVFVVSAAAGAFIGRLRSPTLAAAVPGPTPVATLAATATPAYDLTAPPSAPPTPSVAATEPLDPATAEEFAADLLAAFQTGDTAYLADRLHPTVFVRYGKQQCRTHVAGFTADPTSNWTVVSSSGPAPWSWVTDDLATTVDNAWTVTVKVPESADRDLHFAPSEGQWRWFLDCGDPLAGG